MWTLSRRFVGLCLVPIVLACLDGTVTLIGQPSGYWDGDYSQVVEGTPVFRMLLTRGPWAYIAGLAVWVLAFVGMILLLPPTLALAVCLQFTLGHALGAFSWLNEFPRGRELPIFVNAMAALGLAVGIRWGWACEPRNDAPRGARLPTAFRWAMIAALCAVPIYYTWPHGF